MVDNPIKLIVLDRDGVINEDSPDYIRSAQEWHPIAGSLEAIARLCHGGYSVVVATNQSGIGRGLFDFDDLTAMHDKMNRLLAEVGGHVSGVFFCPHTPDDGCCCRKPRPGMLADIARRFGVNYENMLCIGDSAGDIQASRAVGVRTALVRTGSGADLEKNGNLDLGGVLVGDNLASVADIILGSGTD